MEWTRWLAIFSSKPHSIAGSSACIMLHGEVGPWRLRLGAGVRVDAALRSGESTAQEVGSQNNSM